jgi:serine/threonine-protein kinase HipA
MLYFDFTSFKLGFGLPVAQCKIAQFEDMKALVVERFDRRLTADGSWIVRLPQEDFCQVRATSPLHKYQVDGGPGISKIMEILLGSEQAERDRANFFKHSWCSDCWRRPTGTPKL